MNNTKKKILIINAHPYEKSFCNALAESYLEGVQKSGFEVKVLTLRDLKYDPILHSGYSEIMELEDDLKNSQELIKWCEHLVVVTPFWWSGLPALLKGFVDRVFLPGFAFKFYDGRVVPEKLLTGKSASVIYTQSSPAFVTYLFLKDAFWNQIKRGWLEFCGFTNVKRLVIDNMAYSNEKARANWLKKVNKCGVNGF